MYPKSKRFNPAEPGWMLPILLVILSVGLLYERLATLYAPPVAVSASPALQIQTAADSDTQPASPERREDANLFEQASAAGLLRLAAEGQIVIAPADLPLRQIYAHDRPDLLAPRGDEPDWLSGPWNDEIRRLHQALHFSASGRYVRQQVEAFNTRRTGFAHIRWQDGRLVWRD